MGLVIPEAELLLLLARQDVNDGQLARAAEIVEQESSVVDWARFIDLAVQHRVASLVGWHSRQLVESGPNRDVASSAIALLHDAYLAGISRSGPIKSELARILGACAGLRVAVRKGGHLAFHVYREPGLRPMADFDLLVTRETALSVSASLKDLGYGEGQLTNDGQIRPFTRRQRVFWRLHGSDLPKLSRRADDPFVRSFTVDINVELALPGKGPQVPVGEFLDRAVQGMVGDSPCLLLAPEDTVIDLCLHLYKNSTVLRFMMLGKHHRLLKYVDIAEFLGQAPTEFSWETLMARVEALRLAEPMYFALAHLEMLFPTSVPHEVLADLCSKISEPAKLLQAYGQWDLLEPRSWHAPFLQRFFDPSVDDELPPSRSLI